MTRYFFFIVTMLSLCLSGALLASEGTASSINIDIFSEDHEGLPEGVPEPAILITDGGGAEEDPAWTYRYLIPTSVAIATIVILGNVIQYFRQVTRKRYKVIEKQE